MGWLTKIFKDDRVLLGYVTLGAIGWIIGSQLLLKRWRDEAEIKPPQPKTQYITQETEDALQLSTLETLLGHYNHSIRETAAKILCDRAFNDRDTVELLLWGITRPDYDERMKYLRALAVIADPRGFGRLHTWKAYAALVRSLELSLDPEQEVLDDETFDEYPLRDMTEKLCLMFINQLVTSYDAGKLIKAQFVEKWLAKQNWGATPEERQRNFQRYMRYKANRITDIVSAIRAFPSGREALQRAGLIPASARSDLDGDDGMPYIERLSVLIPSSVNISGLGEDEQARLLLRSLQGTQSAEEQRVRHRHRQAIVMNDGSHPVSREDIIQRPESPT